MHLKKQPSSDYLPWPTLTFTKSNTFSNTFTESNIFENSLFTELREDALIGIRVGSVAFILIIAGIVVVLILHNRKEKPSLTIRRDLVLSEKGKTLKMSIKRE